MGPNPEMMMKKIKKKKNIVTGVELLHPLHWHLLSDWPARIELDVSKLVEFVRAPLQFRVRTCLSIHTFSIGVCYLVREKQ